MPRPPKHWQPPPFVNLHGDSLDLAALRAQVGLPKAQAAPAPTAPIALQDADVQAVFDALCLAGSPRSKTWLMTFLKVQDQRSSRHVLFSSAEVEAALCRLALDQRAHSIEGDGWTVAPQALQERLPQLLSGPLGKDAWRHWARASSAYALAGRETPRAQFRHPRECVALARLALYSGMNREAFVQASQQVLGEAGELPALAGALCAPFIPELFEHLEGDLAEFLMQRFGGAFDLSVPLWKALLDWVDLRLDPLHSVIPPAFRLALAERRAHAGDSAGSRAMLDTLQGDSVELVKAGLLAWQGQWRAASQAFAEAQKRASKSLGVKRGLGSMALRQWQVLSLLAQSDPAAWALARKFCMAESGSRKPAPDQGWGLWAHAIAVRLGDEPQHASAFSPASYWPAGSEHDDNSNRLILSAWLGERSEGWNEARCQASVQFQRAQGRPWKADLLRQACARLDLPEPLRAADEGPAWPVAFYGKRQEPWRDALAAIEALGAKSEAAQASAAAPATLQWQLTLDDQGRVSEVRPWERSQGVRGAGRLKPVPLLRVKKSLQLDARDAVVARCIEASRWMPSQLAIDITGAAIALVGHPALAFSDAPDQLVDLREALPVLEVLRQRDEQGAEHFVFRLADALTAPREARVGERFTTSDPTAEAERRNSLRIFRDNADSARLVRISAAQRRVAELVAKRWSVPLAAKAELDAALRVLSGHFLLHSDADAGQAVPAEPRLRAQLSPSGDGLQLRLLVRPFGEFGPLVAPGRGRARLMTLHEGLSLSTERDLALEHEYLVSVLEELPFLDAGGEADSGWRLDDPEQALAAVERLPKLPAVLAVDWPRGKPLRVMSVSTQAMTLAVASGTDWFAVEGEVQIDEGRVLGLQRLMDLAHASRQGRFIALGDGEYLALTTQLRQQLADLQAMGQSGKSGLKLPAVAAAWMAETLEGTALKGDKPWARRLKQLGEAAALQPEVPAALQAQLRGYQAEGYAWMTRLAHAGLGACLADDMGLGKTVQTLALLLARAALGPQLVIAPTSVCGNWLAETARFAPSLRVLSYGDGERTAMLEAAGPQDLVIASYALAQIDDESFGKVNWATLVLDEAQALKNAATKRAKSVSTLNAQFRLALTGTPVENRLADLWSIMNLLNPGLLGTSGQFSERFTTPIERERDESARLRLRRLVSPFLLRRTKAQVLTDLPPRTEIVHRVEPGPEERSFLEALRRSAIERVASLAEDASPGQASFHVLAELTRLRRAACDPRLVAPELGMIGAKAAEFEQLAIELVAGRHKALVFSQFTDFLKLLGERLVAAGIAYQYLDGSTPAAERTKRVAAFQRGEGELFLISLKAGGFGLNLTAADYVLIVDPWWNPAAEDQAMGRAHRIGQQRPVTVYRLVTAGSIEERIVALHQDKRSLADGILADQDSSAPLRAEQLRELLELGSGK